MKLRCSRCGKFRYVKPAYMKRNNATPENNLCRTCNMRKNPFRQKKQDRSTLNKLLGFAEMRKELQQSGGVR